MDTARGQKKQRQNSPTRDDSFFEPMIRELEADRTTINAHLPYALEDLLAGGNGGFGPGKYIATRTRQGRTDNFEYDTDSDREEDRGEGSEVTAKEALGEELEAHINGLNAVGPGPISPRLRIVPRLHQNVGYNKLLYLESTKYKGGILCDGTGMGKTLTMVQLILATAGSGPTLIVTKKYMIETWVKEIKSYVREDQPLRVLVSTRETEAADLHQYDIIIINYEFIVAEYSAIQSFEASFESNITPALKKIPMRPNCCILSKFHRVANKPFFRVILDESQYAGKNRTVTNDALRNIFRIHTVMASATFLDNIVEDVFATVLVFLMGHPITTIEEFEATFCSKNSNGKKTEQSTTKVNRLVRFLLGVCIGRPKTVLNLPDMEKKDVIFDLNIEEYNESAKFMQANGKVTISRLVKALQATIHPKLCEATTTSLVSYIKKVDASEEPQLDADKSVGASNQLGGKFSSVEQRQGSQKVRAEWLAEMAKTDVKNSSSRMKAFWKQYEEDCTKFPKERSIVVSTNTAVIDLVEEMFVQNAKHIKIFKYDGRMDVKERNEYLRLFQESPAGSSILLMTAQSGGVGLNMPEGSIMYQMETWWNSSTEAQCYGRIHRQGQKKPVKIRRFISKSHVEFMILSKNKEKAMQIAKVMGPLIRDDHIAPDIPSLKKSGWWGE